MVQFAKCMSLVSGEAVREILAMMSDPTLLAFGGGSPAKETLPIDTIKRLTAESLETHTLPVLQYGATEGWLPLREAYLQELVLKKGVKADISNVMTLTGSTQGIDIIAEMFIDPGDTVLVESPTFLSTLNVFRRYSAQIVPLAVDEEGMIPEDVEEKMKKHRPKLLYAIPTFQNPTGRTLTLERRAKIAELAAKYDVLVLEDDPYCELRYKGKGLPPIKSFDESGHVVMLNSFSKILSPGIRVGAMTAASEIIAKACDAKQLADTHTPNLVQDVCAMFLNRGMLPPHLEQITPIYALKLDAMLDGIAAHFPSDCSYTRPEGGLFVWVTLPQGVDAAALLRRSIEELCVAFVPGAPFFVNPEDGRNTLRLNFSSNQPERISEGMEKLGGLLHSM